MYSYTTWYRVLKLSLGYVPDSCQKYPNSIQNANQTILYPAMQHIVVTSTAEATGSYYIHVCQAMT